MNFFLCIITIALGLIGLMAPKYTARAIDLHPGDTLMGLSEMRAASGALYVALGFGALWLGSVGVLMMGIAWAGAAFGRGTSLLLDDRSRQKWTFFIIEAAYAAVAIGLNWPQ